ncbi:hypothetical protein HDU86_002146 [Geranomyces michiganensis]|nr:hypothetical protein HDU86_002146 [Geranomyces michiganensis]
MSTANAFGESADVTLPAAAIKTWAVFTKAKHALPDGQRLENLSWRLMHRQLAKSAQPWAIQPHHQDHGLQQTLLNIEFSARTLFDSHSNDDHNVSDIQKAQRICGSPAFAPPTENEASLSFSSHPLGLHADHSYAVAVSDIFPVPESVVQTPDSLLSQSCPTEPRSADSVQHISQPAKPSTRRASHTPAHDTPPECNNCGTEKTPLWRRDPNGQPICNACGLFFKLHGVPRPISLKKNVVRRRTRKKEKSNEVGLGDRTSAGAHTALTASTPLQTQDPPPISSFTAPIAPPDLSGESRTTVHIVTTALNDNLGDIKDGSPLATRCSITDELVPPSPCPPPVPPSSPCFRFPGKRRRGDSDAPMYPLPVQDFSPLPVYPTSSAIIGAAGPPLYSTSPSAPGYVLQQPFVHSLQPPAPAPSPTVLRGLLQQFIDDQSREGNIPSGVDIPALLRGLESMYIGGSVEAQQSCRPPPQQPPIKLSRPLYTHPESSNFGQQSATPLLPYAIYNDPLHYQQYQYPPPNQQSPQQQPSMVDGKCDHRCLSLANTTYTTSPDLGQHHPRPQQQPQQRPRQQLECAPPVLYKQPAPPFGQVESAGDLYFARPDFHEVGRMWSCEEPFGSLSEAFVDRVLGFGE